MRCSGENEKQESGIKVEFMLRASFMIEFIPFKDCLNALYGFCM